MTDPRTTGELEGEIDLSLSLSLSLWNFRSIDIHRRKPAQGPAEITGHVGYAQPTFMRRFE